MAYSKNEAIYQGYKDELMAIAPKQVRDYFMSNWDVIHNEWVYSEKSKQGNLLNSTNNRLESINQKLKTVISKFSTLSNFTDSFFSILKTLCIERDHIASKIIQTKE